MKLKLVVASIGVMGLVSCPLLAAASANYKAANYKGEMNTRAPHVKRVNSAMTEMSQNIGRDVFNSDWFRKIKVHAGMNVDFAWGQRSLNYQGVNTKRISMNDVYLGLHGDVNRWTDAYIELSYNNASNGPSDYTDGDAAVTGRKSGVYSSAAMPGELRVDQAYVTFHGVQMIQLPFFVQLGKQYLDFGRYHRHAMTRSMTQVMSEANLPAVAELGAVSPSGLHGSIAAFDSPATQTSQSHTRYIYAASAGYDHPDSRLGYDIGGSYLSNIMAVDDVRSAVNAFSVNPMNTYVSRVGAYALYADLNSGPFDFGVRLVSAGAQFDVADLTRDNIIGNKAKPRAFDLTGAYTFHYMGKQQKLSVSYEKSNQALNLILPENRVTVAWNVDMWKGVNLGLAVVHNDDYSQKDGGSGETSTTLNGRVCVKFG